jgi:hypothetical protein
MYQNFETLNEMRAAAIDIAAGYRDYTRQKADVSFDQNANLVVPTSGTLTWEALLNGVSPDREKIVNLPMDDWALGQVCNRLAVPQAYARRCPPELRATNLNYWLTAGEDNGNDWFIRTIDGRARAVLTSVYQPFSHVDMLDNLIETVGDCPYELRQTYLTHARMVGKLVVRTANLTDLGPEGGWGIGFGFGNGEVGNKKINMWSFLLRTACLNSSVFDKDKLEVMHVAHSNALMSGMIREYAGQALRLSRERLEEVVAAGLDEIPHFTDVVRELAREEELSEDVTDLIMVGSEGAQTRLGLVNGLSFAGARMESEDPDEALALELFSGAVLLGERQNQLAHIERRVS